jgi:site-specific DNA recombinase
VRVYNKHPQSHLRLGALKQRWINDEKEFVVLENAHPAIVAKELFQKANISSRGKFGKGYAQIVKSEYLLSGLIKCGSCGFNFSGQRYYKSGNHYYQDSGYINKGRSVCSSFLIQKEKIESFVVQNIKDNILAANLESRLQHIVEKQLESRLTGKDLTLDRLEKALDANKSQMNNIIEAIAQGIKVDTVLERVSQLEAERDRLLREREKQERVSIKKDDVRELAKTITKEVHHFEHAFESAPPPEKKRWIRRFLLGIDVDRAKNRALCYIMKIPMVSHPVMTALLPSESSIIVVAGAGLEPATFGL